MNITLTLLNTAHIIFSILFGLFIFMIVYYKTWVRIHSIFTRIRMVFGGRRNSISEFGKTETLTGSVKPVHFFIEVL